VSNIPEPDSLDSPWKEALERYFEPFLAFFFPTAHAGIDWSRAYEFLDKELQQVVRDAEAGLRLADKLAKVWRHGGGEAWVLIHVEVQGQVDADLPERMYVYNYRLFDRYRRPVVSMAVLGDGRPGWRPDMFGYDLWGCEVRLRFPVVKLLDYRTADDALEQDPNPFSVLVLAHLKTQATRRDPNSRLDWKLRLVRSLYERGYSREDILELFRLIDWMMILPEELDRGFETALRQYEESGQMPYITSIERRAAERGRAEGLEQGQLGALREAVIEALEIRLSPLTDSLRADIIALEDVGLLKALRKQALTAESLGAFLAFWRAAEPQA